MAAGLQPFFAWGARLFGAALVGLLVIAVYRSIGRLSPRAGALVAAGIVLRAAIGTGLFFVSYLDLPQLRGVHSGDGFWNLAPDAREYYALATGASGGAVVEGGPSPAFVQGLALWMEAVGASPASAAFLNLCCYLVLAWMIVRLLEGREAVALAALAAFTFSPALLVFGSQALKDTFFITLLASVCGGAWALLREHPEGGRQLARDAVIAALVAVPLSLVAGIRGYAAVFVGLALTIAVLFGALWPPRPGTWRRVGRGVLIVLLVNTLWVSGRGGQALDRARLPDGIEAAEEGFVARIAQPFDVMRTGFTRSGGATNLGNEVTATGFGGRLHALGYGLLVTFVPFSLLAWTGVVPMVGKRAFIAIADLDTLFMDLSLAVLGLLVAREARKRGLDTSYAVFAGVLAVGLTLALAYVVTNYGTLFRLRLMAASSFWMVALAVRQGAGERHG